MKSEPKSYLTEARLAELRPHGESIIALQQSEAAKDAGDRDTMWAWLARADLPAYALLHLKNVSGADFIRKWGFKTAVAEAAYGPDWLEQNRLY